MKHILQLIALNICLCANAQNGWTPKADYAGCRRGFGFSFVVNNQAYAGGGDAYCYIDETGGDTDFYMYSPDINTWQMKKSIPITDDKSQKGFVLDKYIFIFNRDTLLRYEPADDQWKRMKQLPFALNDNSYVSFAVNNKGYLALGYQNNKVWEYESSNDSWTSKKNSPFQLEDGIAIESPGRVFILGGGSSYATLTDKVWEYIPNKDTWVSKAQLPTKRTNFAGFHIDGKIYITTGFRDSFNYSNAMHRYDISSNTWSTLPPFPGNVRQDASGFSIGKKGYIVNGYDGSSFYNPYKELWEFDPEKLSVLPLQNQISLSVYPSPASGCLNIETKGNLPLQLIVMDASGKEIIQAALTESSYQLDTSGLANGIYFYKIYSQNQEKTQVGKFYIVQQ